LPLFAPQAGVRRELIDAYPETSGPIRWKVFFKRVANPPANHLG
jgi:hypothetical protein